MEGAEDRLGGRERASEGTLSTILVARLAAVLFLLSGVVVFVTINLPLRPGAIKSALAIVGAATLAAGAITWFAPWDRWRRRATLFIVVPALSLLLAGNLFGGIEPYSYGTYFILMFAWIGISQPRGTALLLAVPAGLVYVVPLIIRDRPPQEISTASVVIPLCVIVGEFLAWTTTRLRKVENELRDSATGYRILFEDNPQPMFVYDLNTLRIIAVNEATTTHYGYSRAEFEAMTILDIRPADDIPALLDNVAKAKSGLERSGLWRHQKKDGTVIEVEITSNSLTFNGKDARHVLVNDVTEKNRALRELTAMAALPQQNPAPVVRLDRHGVIETINPATEEFFGEDLVGKAWSGICPEVDINVLAEIATQGGFLQQEIEVKDRTLLLDYRGLPDLGVIHVYGFEVTATKQAQAQLTHQSLHDSLTGLANRSLFVDRTSHAIARSSRHNLPISVLLIDLDDFKSVNDTLGHEGGDGLLLEIARRIHREFRPEDTIARFGADEFAILLEETDEEEATRLAGRVLTRIAEPAFAGPRSFSITASIGLVSSKEFTEPEELIRDADVAMHFAKSHGKGHLQLFNPSMHLEVVRRIELKGELERALDRSEFVLHYQPIVDLQTNTTVSVEALIRWKRPIDGLVSPDDFISFAEETGLIHPIGRWVRETAAKQAKAWSEDHPDRPNLAVNINLSARELERPELVHEIGETLLRHELPPSSFSIEITESMLVGNVPAIVERLRQLRGLGLKIAIDDFGTGYSSLSYLQRLPVDVLKIDKAFTEAISHNSEDSAVAHAIVKLGHSLRLLVVAEGIETEEQASLLREWG